MKVFFDQKNADAVVQKIDAILTGRKLGELVTIQARDSDLVMTISKLGTSTLTFTGTAKGKGMEFLLTSEKIAFAHRPLKDDFKQKLCQTIEQAGGKISE